ncbi:phosphate signaling complex protein PhoU [Balneolaceae bacterium YR4-1]|uniref:Phosphate-specific transport system accessory protein PhoU n=1 Tax=Halalkalibaculum roseum TaxID=2709311 RepID=A0A6M1T9M0_9BACT|nr:phosphate signaling complex protein PhoU [Halalkalibaculum roseum]NGP76913.1 phosphate signaling complex protein PhoU [Halalkalibaculum roseum]
MAYLDTEISLLNDDILELMYLVKTQLEKGHEALIDYNEELAHEITANEKRVDALELKIDRDCENILALFNPVAVDLRFVLASFKINSDLERLGDHANSIAKYILDFGGPIDEELIEEMRIEEMYETAIEMLSNVFSSFISEDTQLARKVFAKDKVLNEINREASDITAKLLKKDPEKAQQYLYLFSIIRKLERVGDLTKNTAEELIFYIEAKVLKHKKNKSKNGDGKNSESNSENESDS